MDSDLKELQELTEQVQMHLPSELVIRKGEAMKLREPNAIVIEGNIKAVAAYIAGRKEHTDKQGLQYLLTDRAIIIVNEDAGTIELKADPENFFGPIIKASLEEATDLQPFNINGASTFTREQVVKVLRFNRLLFANADVHAKVLEAFQKFSVQAQLDLQQSKDTRGNVGNTFNKTVTTAMPTDFILTAPIYKGFPPETFRVEIAFDLTESSAKFWFESVELREALINRKKEIIADQLKQCEGFVVINE